MPDSSSILDHSRVRTAVLAAGARFVSLDFLLSSILSYIFLGGGGGGGGGRGGGGWCDGAGKTSSAGSSYLFG